MTKELVISANRHETRVAIVEDDQVVEVYHQRENEYSLAGSIHKGRVTRVLPGMQSAFVDIGLERDAFLYVSDFFEDNEEYDKIVTSVEDKVLKLDRPTAVQGSAAAAAEETVAAPEVSTPAPAAEAGSSESPAAAPATIAVSSAPPVSNNGPAGVPGGDPRRDDRRGGRRGRRRRGQKGGGRGLPESKFYSPRPEGEHRYSGPPSPPPESSEATDFLVLPGESLAKHRITEREAEEADESAEALAGEYGDPEADAAEPSADNGPEPAVATEPVESGGVEAEPEPEAAAPTPSIEVELHGAAAEAVEDVREVEAAEIAETVETVETVSEPVCEPAVEAEIPRTIAEPEVVIAAVEIESAPAGEPAVEAAVSEEGELIGDEASPSDVDLAESLVDALENPFEGGAEAADGESAVTGEDGPEPARIPTSLTATLREQGPRYLHRVSRRMRRRGRGGQQDVRQPHESRGGEPAPRAPEQRTVSAPRPQAEGRPASTSISDLLKEGQEIIVQIAKEPLGQKGARITSHIALPGRFLVYMPTVDHIGVSRKIPTEEERQRLKRILLAHRTGIPGGYIVRTAGEGRSEEELRADMMFLYNLWLDMRQKAERRPAPMLIHHDLNVVERVLRDQLTSAFKSIWVDNEEVYESVLRFVQRFQPALVSRVKLYTRPTPIFDEFSITSELEKALRPKVWLKSGGHIVINQTEALVAIDINTGKYVGKSNRLEDTIVKTNTDAIREIVRQIRLRDLGGIIVVDFIDMDERKNRQKVMQALEEAMRADRAPYKILQFNDFGLVAITRKRVKQSLERTLCMPCPYCEGAGYVKSPQTVVGEILQEANKIARAVEGKDVLLRVAPEVAKLLKSNQNTYLQELEEVLGRTVIVKSDHQLHQEKFDLA